MDWGGHFDDGGRHVLNTGGKYQPATNIWTSTSTTNAPSARDSHTAVWTGTEMIVWGGYAGLFPSNIGARYNPIADTWLAINTSPTARGSDTAVWTGTEMIVWGGYDETFYPVNSGGRYDPGIDVWMPTSTINAPSARYSHAAIWTGNEMIVWGGDAANSTGLNTGGKYNPGTNSWTPTSITNAPHARLYHTAVWSGTEMIIWGGYFSDINGDNYLNTGGRYTSSTDSWTDTSTTSVPVTRAYHTAIWTGTEMIVWGGYYFDGINNYVLNSGGKYNPDTNTSTATSNTGAPLARYSPTAVCQTTEM